MKFKVAVHDESIFIYDVIIRKVWVLKGSRPIMLATGSHRRVVVSGIICEDGSQLFRTYDSADSDSFLDLLHCVLRKYNYLALFVDKAKWHREKRVRELMRKNRHRLKIFWFPSGHPELNPMEECWRQGKDNVLGSMFFDRFSDFKTAVRAYYRTKRFKLLICTNIYVTSYRYKKSQECK